MNFTFDKMALHMLKQHNIIKGNKSPRLVTDMTKRRRSLFSWRLSLSRPPNWTPSRQGSCQMMISVMAMASASHCSRIVTVRTTWKQANPPYLLRGVNSSKSNLRMIVIFLLLNWQLLPTNRKLWRGLLVYLGRRRMLEASQVASQRQRARRYGHRPLSFLPRPCRRWLTARLLPS